MWHRLDEVIEDIGVSTWNMSSPLTLLFPAVSLNWLPPPAVDTWWIDGKAFSPLPAQSLVGALNRCFTLFWSPHNQQRKRLYSMSPNEWKTRLPVSFAHTLTQPLISAPRCYLTKTGTLWKRHLCQSSPVHLMGAISLVCFAQCSLSNLSHRFWPPTKQHHPNVMRLLSSVYIMS